jgi:hypothetical protein
MTEKTNLPGNRLTLPVKDMDQLNPGGSIVNKNLTSDRNANSKNGRSAV